MESVEELIQDYLFFERPLELKKGGFLVEDQLRKDLRTTEDLWVTRRTLNRYMTNSQPLPLADQIEMMTPGAPTNQEMPYTRRNLGENL